MKVTISRFRTIYTEGETMNNPAGLLASEVHLSGVAWSCMGGPDDVLASNVRQIWILLAASVARAEIVTV